MITPGLRGPTSHDRECARRLSSFERRRRRTGRLRHDVPIPVWTSGVVIKINIADRLQPPSASHWFGTDQRAIGLSFAPKFSRVVRAAVMSVRDNEYIEAARSIGARDTRIIASHVLPNPINPEPVCRFAVRCNQCMDICARQEPPLVEARPNHFVACHLHAPMKN